MAGLNIELGTKDTLLDRHASVEATAEVLYRSASCEIENESLLTSDSGDVVANDYDSKSYLKHTAMGMSMELSLCFVLTATFGENTMEVLAMILFWVMVRAVVFVAAALLVSRRLLCLTFLLNILPFLAYFCWLVVDLLDLGPEASCSYGHLQRNITSVKSLVGQQAPSVQFESLEIVCRPKRWQHMSRRIPVATAAILIIQIGVPVLYAFMVLGALQRFSSESIKKRYTQLQLIVLDFLDVCNAFTFFFYGQNFVYLQTYPAWRDPLLVLFTIMFLLALLEVCMAYELIRCNPSDVIRVSLLIDLPLGALRCLFVPMGLQLTYPFLAKNFICMLTELAILSSGDVNNPVSSTIKDYLSMLPGAERLESKVEKESMFEKKAEISALHGALRKATEVIASVGNKVPRLRSRSAPECYTAPVSRSAPATPHAGLSQVVGFSQAAHRRGSPRSPSPSMV